MNVFDWIQKTYTSSPFTYKLNSIQTDYLRKHLNTSGSDQLFVQPFHENDANTLHQMHLLDDSGEFNSDSMNGLLEMQQNREGIIWCAKFNSVIVGHGIIEFNAIQFQIGVLRSLLVDPKCRNRGIGSKIMESREQVLRAIGMNYAHLEVKKGSNAKKLYERRGYVTITDGKNILNRSMGKLPMILHDDACFMSKNLIAY